MEIIGHRGLPVMHVENTLGSFEDAFKNGADAVELDVQLTSDQVPVVFHDFDLGRLAGMDSRIYDLSLSEIKKIGLGKTKDSIPTLDEVFKKFKNRKIYVELKTIDDQGNRHNEALPEILYKRYGDSSLNVVFISFDPKSIEELRSYSEKFQLGLDYEKSSEKILPIDSLKSFLIENRVEYFIPDVKILGEFTEMLQSNFKIAPWVVNDINTVIGYLKHLSGVISDRCDIISRQIK